MRRNFSTRDVHPRDRLAFWQDVACKAFVEIECRTEAGPSFDATIWSGTLAEVGVSIVDTDQCDVYRKPRGIALATADDVLLSLQLAGTATLAQDGRQVRLSTGDFAIYDTMRTYTLCVSPAVRQLVLKLPRQELERRLGPILRYSARPVRADAPLGSFASGFIGLIPSRIRALDQIDANDASQLSQQLLDIVALALRGTAGIATDQSTSREISLARLKMVIDERLSDPSLRPLKAAAAARMSVRYANELLATEDTALERYILDRRLERCAAALADPRQGGRRIGDIAFSWGFSDASHFGRCFRQRFQESPRDYRRGVATSEDS